MSSGRRPGGRRRTWLETATPETAVPSHGQHLPAQLLARAKAAGFSDAQIGQLAGLTEAQVRELRHMLGVRPVYHTVDTCAAEFEARTPYLYSTYDLESEVPGGTKPKVIILGSGPNRIGQGIEFDYACVHASFALSDAGLRDRDGQLQPGDRVHGLRHVRTGCTSSR